MSSDPAKPTVERRRVIRQKSFLRGTIYFNNRINAVDCLVRDISSDGARLIFTDSVTTPDTLELHIPQKDQTLRVHVIWRHGQEAGVAFTQAAHVDADAGDPGSSAGLAERVARLELEIAGLKRLLKKLKTDAGPEFEVA
jgi:hypothetical protein